MIQLAYFSIFASLLCLIPWGLIQITASLLDNFYLNPKYKKRKFPFYVWVDNIEPDVRLYWRHEELQELGFRFFGAFRLSDSPKSRFWAYQHPEKPFIVAALSRDMFNIHNQTEFVTGFDENRAIITTNGGTRNQVFEKLIINNVETGVIKAFEYHQVVVESELSRFGEPFPLTDSSMYMEFLNRFCEEHQEFLFKSSYRGEAVAFHIFSVIAGLIGLLVLILMYLGELSNWQIYFLAALTPIMVIILTRWLVHLEPNVEQRAQKKKAM